MRGVVVYMFILPVFGCTGTIPGFRVVAVFLCALLEQCQARNLESLESLPGGALTV